MKAVFGLTLAFLLSNSAHAGLFTDLSKQEDQRIEQDMRDGEARDLARRIEIVRNVVAQSMGVDPGSVAYEGISDEWPFGSGFTFNVGGVWGCLGSLTGASCINAQTHQHQYFHLKSAKRRSRE